MRYRILKILDYIFRKHVKRCNRCGKRLTAEEEYIYEAYCEKCEDKNQRDLLMQGEI